MDGDGEGGEGTGLGGVPSSAGTLGSVAGANAQGGATSAGGVALGGNAGVAGEASGTENGGAAGQVGFGGTSEGGAGGAIDGGGEAGVGGEGGASEPTEPCVLRVKPTGSDLNDGSSWSAAFATIEGALLASSKRPGKPGCEVWVAEGTYAPVPWSREAWPTLRVPDGTKIYGGFLGTEETLAARSGSRVRTIVTGIKKGTTERLRPVLTTEGHARIDQLTIRDGDSPAAGGGIVCESGELVLSDVLVTRNVALDGGGLLVTSGCSAQVQASIFERNDAGETASVKGGRGGGIANLGGRLVVRGGRFTSNLANVRGGAVYTTGDTDIADAEFATNSVVAFAQVGAVAGGAIYAEGAAGAPTRVRGCTLRANSLRGQPSYGAGLAGSELFVVASQISQNTYTPIGTLYGGGIYATGRLTVDDSTIERNGPNRYGVSGGGVYFEQGELRVRRTVFDANGGENGAQLRCAVGCRGQVSASFSGAPANPSQNAVYFDGTSLDLVNSVFSGGIYPLLRVDSASGAVRVIHSTFATTYTPDRVSIQHLAGSLSVESSVMHTFTPAHLRPVQIESAVPASLTIEKSNIVGLCDGPSSCGSNWDVVPVYDLLPYPASDSFVIDAGGAPLPPDWLDLDDDGNVTEALPVDFDGNPRVAGARSDLGAIEVVP